MIPPHLIQPHQIGELEDGPASPSNLQEVPSQTYKQSQLSIYVTMEC